MLRLRSPDRELTRETAHVNVSLEASISNIKLQDDLVLDELESQKFMRTKSTQTLKDKPAKAKWDGVMSMFKEWKHHNSVAEGQQVYVARLAAPASIASLAPP